MVDFDYFVKGLNALARAHRVNTMAGHLGAAVVAGYFISEQNPDLGEKVYDGIESQLKLIIAGRSVFSPRKRAPITVAEMFKPFPKEKPKQDLIDGIAAALSRNIDKTRQSGHNVIFAAIAIRALKDHPDLATPSITDGIRKLIAGFNGKTPGNGYYGKKKGRIDGRRVILPKDDARPYASLEAMAKTVMAELIDHASQRRQGFGGLTHLINHAAALAELAQYGYKKLARNGLAGHYHHLRLWRTLPDLTKELGAPTAAKSDPGTKAFWKSAKVDRAHAKLTHRVKTLYGFDALAELIEDKARRKKAEAELRYLL